MKAPSGYVIVRGRKFDDKFTTAGGFELFKFIQKGNETHDVNYSAEVVAIPDDAKDGIENEVKVGDKVYFHYNSFLSEGNWIPRQCMGIEENSGEYWRVAYYDIFCAVRDGEIVPVGGWSFIEPDVRKVETGNIISDISVKSETQGVLRHIGTPRRGQEVPDVQVGDTVLFEEHDAFENEIEGVKYYCMPQDRILCTVE